MQVDWRDCFAGDVGSVFQRFEWALGTGEGKCDILGYEDVGLSESAHVNNLDLASVTACIVTVRGWRRDGRCTELSAKAHALKGQLCVHRRLIVGDGFVSMTKGESIQRFFERAEETEEEEVRRFSTIQRRDLGLLLQIMSSLSTFHPASELFGGMQGSAALVTLSSGLKVLVGRGE